MADWWPKAAILYVDMERGLYEFPDGKKPRHRDGRYRVVKRQILIDCGITPSQKSAGSRIWNNPAFTALIDAERRRRDTGIACVVEEIEKVSGPLLEMREEVEKHVRDIFKRGPDSDDPESLSPKDYVAQGLVYMRYIDELYGKTSSQQEQTIHAITKDLVENNRITHDMVKDALELADRYRQDQARMLDHALGN